MLVDPDLPPSETTYYVAARVLHVLRTITSYEFDLATVVTKLRDEGEELPADAVLLALDYLFLVGRIELVRSGSLKCI